MGLVVVVHELGDGFVVTSAYHAGWCGLRLDCESISFGLSNVNEMGI
jgi:hypothetical protein